VFVKLSEEVRTALLRPLRRFREELQAKLRDADREFDGHRRAGTGVPPGSPGDDYARAGWELVSTQAKALAVFEMKVGLDVDEPFYRRKLVLLEDEGARLQRHQEELKKRMRSLLPFGGARSGDS
jgi:hypothetical protein